MNKVVILIAVLFIFGNTTFAATAVSGQIRTNTTWTKAGSPYICTGLIQVDSFSTLTIEPGTIIDLDGGIKAYKSIVFKYNATDTTVIKSHGSTFPNIEIENLNYTDTIQLKHMKIISCGIYLKWIKSNVIIEECNFNVSRIEWHPTSTGMQSFIFRKNKCTKIELSWFTNISSRLIIDSNYFDSVYNYSTILIPQPMNTLAITNNVFKNIPTTVMEISAGEQMISGNTFYRVQNAYRHHQCASPIRILSNVFTETDVALNIEGIGGVLEIRDNNFYNNNIGVAVNYRHKLTWAYAPADSIIAPILDGNCFYDNKISGFAWYAKNNISIGANWWGTTDTTKIDSAIIDNKDDFRIGTVSYKPNFLTSNPGCKVYTFPAKAEKIIANSNEVQVYPNPFLSTLEIKSNGPIKSVALYNLVGKMVYQSYPQRNSISVNTEEYPTGVYVYRIVTDDNQIIAGKVIRQ